MFNWKTFWYFEINCFLIIQFYRVRSETASLFSSTCKLPQLDGSIASEKKTCTIRPWSRTQDELRKFKETLKSTTVSAKTATKSNWTTNSPVSVSFPSPLLSLYLFTCFHSTKYFWRFQFRFDVWIWKWKITIGKFDSKNLIIEGKICSELLEFYIYILEI